MVTKHLSEKSMQVVGARGCLTAMRALQICDGSVDVGSFFDKPQSITEHAMGCQDPNAKPHAPCKAWGIPKKRPSLDGM